MSEPPRYDLIGTGYAATRIEEPRIAHALWEALGDAASVANIGAGTGNYEPRDRDVIAIEPSAVMIAQRPLGAAPALRGVAERIPLADASVDAAMAVFSDSHWDDCELGLAEMRRVARKRVVALTINHGADDHFWLLRDYLPGYRRLRAGETGLWELAAETGATSEPVPVPWNCLDGFLRAFWRRPRAYLDPAIRAGISVFHRLAAEPVEEAMHHLAADLASGVWRERYGDLLDLEAIDLGLRLVVWPAAGEARRRSAPVDPGAPPSPETGR
jgi:hypothetical protein